MGFIRERACDWKKKKIGAGNKQTGSKGVSASPNVLTQSTAKVRMSSRFVGLVGSLPPDEQQIWLPNQLVHDPQTWFAPHLLQLQSEYAVLLNKHNCNEQEMYIVQDQPLPPSETLILPPLQSL